MKWLWMYIVFLLFAHQAISQAKVDYSFSESSINSDSSDWLGLDENQVFYKKLMHSEEDYSWTIKIGKGGQIYSIKALELGELIAFQRVEHGQWVDEVFQHTIPMPPQRKPTNNVVDGDIHQAGYYIRSDLDKNDQILPRSVYSPIFAYQYDPSANSVNYITWPQHAHLPRRYSENQVLINQTIKDLGGGIVEINVEFNKWGGARYDKLSLPWSAFRASTVPVHIVSNHDGTYREATQSLRDEKWLTKIKEGMTGGWIAFVASNAPSARGIGIVYGKYPRELDGKNGFVRWGNYGPPKRPQIAGTVAAVYRNVNLDAGETLLYRYYLVLGTLADIQMKANRLESKVALNKRIMPQEQAKRLAICQDKDTVLKRICEKDAAPLFYTYKDFVRDSRPLFLLKNTRTGMYMVTDNPYEISFDPTNGITKYVDLLGWAVPKNMATDSCRYQSLSEAMGAMDQQPDLGRDTENLHVMRISDTNCVSPEISK